MIIDSNDVQRLDSPVTGLKDNGDGKWWESSDGHRFAVEVLQLRIRHEIMKFIGLGVKTREEIALDFGMKEHISELHLALLEKAEMIKQTDLGYRSTTSALLTRKTSRLLLKIRRSDRRKISF